MKVTTLLLLAGCLHVSAAGFSQSISLSEKNAKLETVFHKIFQQTGYNFFYNSGVLEKAKPVSINVKNESLDFVLGLCFQNQFLDYKILDKTIIVVENNNYTSPSITVIGVVVNENDEPLEGVTIKATQSKKIVFTSGEGRFILKDVEENETLQISCIGFISQQVAVKGRKELAIKLDILIKGLDETVIIAYGKTTKRLNTGNVSKVSADEIAKQPLSNILNIFSGRVPGLQITQLTGMPGSAFTVRIRGQNSLASGNDPLYIIDGIPFPSTSLSATSVSLGTTRGGNPLSSINPLDIESIEVLKDADATAIYGSRGANGVILITTKKGKAGQTKFDLNFYSGCGKVSRMMPLLNTQQYLSMRHEAFLNDNQTPDIFNAYDMLEWDTTRYTDWQKLLMGHTSGISDAHLQISGGNINTQFLVSGNYHRESTVFPGNFTANRLSFHVSLSHQSLNKKFKITFSNSFVNENNKLPGGDPTQLASTTPPNGPEVYSSDGTLNWGPSSAARFRNPFQIFLRKYKINTNNLLTNLVLSYDLLPGLQFKTSLGFNNIYLNELATNPKSSITLYSTSLASARFNNSSTRSWIIEPHLNYILKLRENKVSVLLGGTLQNNFTQSQILSATNYTNDALIENASAAPNITTIDNYSQYRYLGFFARVTYNYGDKYILNVTGRRDGSSRFGPGKQFANFGSSGIAWVFSKEKLFESKFSFLSYGKIRSSYGSSGNDQIGDYGYLSSYSSVENPYQGVIGLLPVALFNPEFAWEINKKFEAAIELGFLHDRVLFSASYFHNRSSSQLVGYSLAPTTGFSSIQQNLPATVQNTGVEIELRTITLQQKDFVWRSSLVLSVPDSKLIAFPNIENYPSYANKYIIGEAVTVVKAYRFLGVNEQTGIYEYSDIDKDGKISYPNDLTGYKKLGQMYYGGFQNNLQYKAFSVDMLFSFARQNGYNYAYNSPALPGTARNQPTYIFNRWRNEGDKTIIQKYSQDYSSPAGLSWSDYWGLFGDNTIGDASFIRLKNISVTYEFPENFLSRARLSNARIYLQAQNILTFTKYKGYDPENQSNSILPPLKIITAGFQLTF